MTDQEINVALAEFRGWTLINASGDIAVGCDPTLAQQGLPAIACLRPLPDHLNGIEALGHIHEVERILDDAEWDRYLLDLATVVEARRCWKASEADPRSFAHATARQRAIAILRTVEKYRETAA